MASAPPRGFFLSVRPLLGFSRRPSWLYYLPLAVLLFFISINIPFRNSKLVVIRPGDIVGETRQLKPSKDQTPFAHEPVGLGTLRDVREEKFYLGGTLTLTGPTGASHPKPAIYDPYPNYNGEEWQKSGKGTFRACQGPQGRPLNRLNQEDMLLVYPGIQKDFPFPIIGSYEALGLDGHVCTDRYSRYKAYGGDELHHQINWNGVNWKKLQSECFERNANRYRKTPPRWAGNIIPLSPPSSEETILQDETSSIRYNSRTAIILRAWDGMTWTENLKHYVRSLVMELSLHPGAEYEVFLLTHVKDKKIPLYSNPDETIQHLKQSTIPPEFWDMTIFFNDETLEAWYPKIEEHRVMYQHLQPVQIFSQLYRGHFDYYWQLEMDSRITGHTYHFFDQAAKFSKRQPRKYLWERNAYFFIPGAHGTWDEFMSMVDVSMAGRESVWGPVQDPQLKISPAGPKPPVTDPRADSYVWGVGEEADLITFLPIFDPAETAWVFPNFVWNVPEPGRIPRRAAPITMGRFSKTLLDVMHDAEARDGLGLASEMSAPSFALWHGLKAVHVPHPLYVDGKWSPKELGRILNPGPPEKVNGGPDSIWNWDHKWDHILFRMSYMFTTQTADDLFRRWLGYPVDPNQYTDGSYHQDPQGRNWFDGGNLREDLYGPLCFPSMLLHTVKNTAERKGPDMAVPV